jgi:hypothetical protein
VAENHLGYNTRKEPGCDSSAGVSIGGRTGTPAGSSCSGLLLACSGLLWPACASLCPPRVTSVSSRLSLPLSPPALLRASLPHLSPAATQPARPLIGELSVLARASRASQRQRAPASARQRPPRAGRLCSRPACAVGQAIGGLAASGGESPRRGVAYLMLRRLNGTGRPAVICSLLCPPFFFRPRPRPRPRPRRLRRWRMGGTPLVYASRAATTLQRQHTPGQHGRPRIRWRSCKLLAVSTTVLPCCHEPSRPHRARAVELGRSVAAF